MQTHKHIKDTRYHSCASPPPQCGHVSWGINHWLRRQNKIQYLRCSAGKYAALRWHCHMFILFISSFQGSSITSTGVSLTVWILTFWLFINIIEEAARLAPDFTFHWCCWPDWVKYTILKGDTGFLFAMSHRQWPCKEESQSITDRPSIHAGCADTCKSGILVCLTSANIADGSLVT